MLRRVIPFFVALLLLLTVCAAQTAPAGPGARPPITGLAFMRLWSTDLPAAEHFYGTTLGLPGQTLSAVAPEPEMQLFSINHAQWIELLTTAPPHPNNRMAALAFTTTDAPAMEQYLRGRGVQIQQHLTQGEFSVLDPEGNLIFFVQAGTHPEHTAASLDSGHPSHRMIHIGFIVEDRAREDAFYRSLLAFRPYWYGGPKPGKTDYVSLQVPDGTDWIEYMLPSSKSANLHDHGMFNHFSLGTANMDSVVAGLKANGCTSHDCTTTQTGVDGKVQLNVFDPDLTRVEFMEFTPVREPCCSPFTAPHPRPDGQ